MRHVAFISYIHEDEDFAVSLRDWVSDALLGGLEFFVAGDQGSIPLGTEWPNKISGALRECAIAILIMSPQSRDRQWIYFEAGAAFARGVPVIPVCCKGMARSQLTPPLSFLQAVELPGVANESALLHNLARLCGLTPPKTPPRLRVTGLQTAPPPCLDPDDAARERSGVTASNSASETGNDADQDSRAVPSGIVQILPNRAATAQILSQVNSNTTKIRILAISGLTATLTANLYERLAPLKNTDIKCLLLAPNSEFVAARVKENPSRSLVGLQNHINSGIELLKAAKQSNHLSKFRLRVYDEMPVLRLVITDDTAYLSCYPKGPADSTPVFVVQRGASWLFDALEKHFDALWKDEKRSKKVF